MANPDPSAAREAKKLKQYEGSLLDTTNLIFDVNEVEAIKKQLAEERAELEKLRAEKTAAENKLQQFTGVAFGMPQPQPADPYVPDLDVAIPGLNDTNSGDVISGADMAGRPNWKTSRISHRLANRHTQGRAGTFWFYDEGGFARRIPNQSIGAALASGLWPVCPLCKNYHPASETDPNVCPVRPKVAKTRCKICAANGATRWIYDVVEKPVLDASGKPFADDLDDDLVEDIMEVPSTPKDRLKMRLEQHIRAYHKSAAASMRLQAMDD